MKKVIALTTMALTLSAGLAQAAETQVFQGRLKSRQQCADTGGTFARVIGCKPIAIKADRTCTVMLEINRGEPTRVTYKVPEIKANGETRQDLLSTKLKGPYLYERNFRAYTGSLDKKNSMELKISSDNTNRVLQANVYTDHVDVKKDLRNYKMYECDNFVRVK